MLLGPQIIPKNILNFTLKMSFYAELFFFFFVEIILYATK